MTEDEWVTEMVDGDRAPVQVSLSLGVWPSGGPQFVVITIGDKSGNVSASMSPESALDLADRLRDAAAQARRANLP